MHQANVCILLSVYLPAFHVLSNSLLFKIKHKYRNGSIKKKKKAIENQTKPQSPEQQNKQTNKKATL